LKKLTIVFLSIFLSVSSSYLMAGERMMNVIITFDVKSDKVKSFLDIMDNVKENLVKVDGCEAVNIYNDLDDASIFTLVETWKSKEQHSSHISKVVESGDWDVIASHLEKAPVSSYFKKI